MLIVAVLCVFLSFIAALGQSWWWRGPVDPARPWYGNAAFFWAFFLLCLFIMWPALQKMGA